MEDGICMLWERRATSKIGDDEISLRAFLDA
jgi:hypothetical protein